MQPVGSAIVPHRPWLCLTVALFWAIWRFGLGGLRERSSARQFKPAEDRERLRRQAPAEFLGRCSAGASH